MNPIPLGVLGAAHRAGSAVITFLQDARSGSFSAPVATYTSLNLGAAAADRIIIALPWIRHSDSDPVVSLTSLAVAGVSATVDAFQDTVRSSLGIAHALVPSGTAGTVAVTWANATSASSHGIALYSITGAAVTYSASAAQDLTPQGTTIDDLTVTLTNPAGGAIFAHAHSNTADDAWTWTGAVEDYETKSGTNFIHTGAVSRANGSQAITAGTAGTTIGSHLLAVAYALT